MEDDFNIKDFRKNTTSLVFLVYSSFQDIILYTAVTAWPILFEGDVSDFKFGKFVSFETSACYLMISS